MPHDDRVRQLSDQFLADLRGSIEASFREILDRLVAVAADDRDAAVSEARAQASAEHESALAAALAAAREEHGRTLDAAREEHARNLESALQAAAQEHEHKARAALDDARDEHARALEAARVEHGRALDALRAEFGDEHTRAAAASLDEASAAREQAVQLAVSDLRDQLLMDHEAAMAALHDGLELERNSFAEERAALEAALAQVSQERDTARASVAELTDQLAATRAQREQMMDLAHAESAAADERSEPASLEARVEERQAELACSDRLLAGFRDLDDARSLSDSLSTLAAHAASEAPRVAVLLVQNGRLRGWRVAGMGAVSAHAIDLPLAGTGVLERAVTTGCPASTSEATGLTVEALPSFLLAPRGRVGLALPVVVGGRVVAVLYADDGGDEPPSVPSNWPEAIELLARHASRCLEVLTLSRASALPARPARAHDAGPAAPAAALPREADAEQEEESARRHARLLISEIKLYNESLVEQGRRDGNLLGLLGPEIERARRLYEEKIPAAVRQRVDCFDQEIVRTLAGGDRTLLGQTT